MGRVTRILSYLVLGASLGMLVYWFSGEHAHVLQHAPEASKARMMSLFAGCVVVAIGLGLLCARDVTQFIGNRAARLVLSDGAEITPAPALEEAEKIRKNDPLEAVRVLRDYLNQHPGERQVMLRIAEIYEKDLRNTLAAALEYEELLKQRFDPERWGWSAIHLTNLYIRLRQPDKAIALLHRIDQECGETAAAAKARKRLAEIEG
jgi:hypothetical protein